jgi:hypothetical protein
MTKVHTYRESFLTRGQLLKPTNQDGIKEFELTTGVARWNRPPVVKGIGK